MNADKLLSLGRSAHGKFAVAANGLQSPLLLAIRLYWGWSFFSTGKGKLQHFDRTVEFFKSIPIPAPAFNAAMASATECICGLLLMAGLASRLVSIPLIVTMIVAYVTTEHLTVDSDGAQVGFSTVLENFTTATPFLFLFASLLVLAFGPGALSLDHLIGRKFGKASAI